jgi:hypothetical protein
MPTVLHRKSWKWSDCPSGSTGGIPLPKSSGEGKVVGIFVREEEG